MQVGRRESVLLVNSIDDRLHYAEYLRADGLDVSVVATAEEALASLDRSTPGVIVIDAVLPPGRYDAPALVEAVRGRSATRTTPVIVVSPFRRAEDRVPLRSAGADAFLQKPCFADELLTEVRRAMSVRVEDRGADGNWPSERATAADPGPRDRRRH